MSPDHGPSRGRVVFVEPAETQLTKLDANETHRLDRVVVAISVDPGLGTELPGTLLRDYTDKVDGVRVIYYVTALRTIVVVTYVEA
ncbi:type II toxin-antitoxin system RelE/ParE family toxin [Streptomyces gamaensis]|uniref:Type II toxin-antitoxin system RelE/ParE family toxin n=1 Tax=Streptomyces gamaensis TaxID=1763542 RepID=A0ABW0Z278_9ACTN